MRCLLLNIYLQGKPMANGMGSMALLTSFIYLADAIFSLLDVQRNNTTDSGGRYLHEMSHM